MYYDRIFNKLPKLIDAIAQDDMMTLHGFGMKMAHTTAMQNKVMMTV